MGVVITRALLLGVYSTAPNFHKVPCCDLIRNPLDRPKPDPSVDSPSRTRYPFLLGVARYFKAGTYIP